MTELDLNLCRQVKDRWGFRVCDERIFGKIFITWPAWEHLYHFLDSTYAVIISEILIRLVLCYMCSNLRDLYDIQAKTVTLKVLFILDNFISMEMIITSG